MGAGVTVLWWDLGLQGKSEYRRSVVGLVHLLPPEEYVMTATVVTRMLVIAVFGFAVFCYLSTCIVDSW